MPAEVADAEKVLPYNFCLISLLNPADDAGFFFMGSLS